MTNQLIPNGTIMDFGGGRVQVGELSYATYRVTVIPQKGQRFAPQLEIAATVLEVAFLRGTMGDTANRPTLDGKVLPPPKLPEIPEPPRAPPIVDTTREQGPAKAVEYDLILGHPEAFADDFSGWLSDNWHIWREFRRQVDEVRRRGYTHYSARTVIHYIRHHTALSENNGEGWKVNNNYSPDLARLWVLLNPGHETFFEFRVIPGSSKRVA